LLAYRQEKVTRELEAMRQAREEDEAQRREQARQAREEDEAQRREQAEAGNVMCDAWTTDSHLDDGTLVAGAIAVTLTNRTESVLSDVRCVVPFGGIGSVPLRNALAPGEQIGPVPLTGTEPIRLTGDVHEVRGSVSFTFLLNGQWWERCPANLQAIRMPRRLD
jgi:hypothetical protein